MPQALVSSIFSFLSEHGFHGASKTLEKEQKVAVAKGTVTPTSGAIPSLLDLFQSWEAKNSGPATEESGVTSDSTSDDDDSDEASDSESDSDGSDNSDSSAESVSEPGSTSDSDSASESDSDASMKEKTPIASKKVKRDQSPLSDVTSSSSESNSDENADDSKSTQEPAKSTALKRKAESSSSESDGDVSTTKKAKFVDESEDSASDSSSADSESSVSDSVESEDSESESNPESESASDSSPEQIQNELKNEQKLFKIAAKTPIPASSDAASSASDDEDCTKTQPLGRKSSSDTSGTLEVPSHAVANALAQTDQGGKKKKHTGARPTPLAAASERHHDHPTNDYKSYAYAERAYKDLSVTRGKGFTKEKNKKKRGSYRGGPIDIGPSRYSFKFED